MNIYSKIAGILIIGLGLLALLNRGQPGGIVFILVGLVVIFFKDVSTNLRKKHARKELMELKEFLDNGTLTKEEYEEKSIELKNKI